MKCPPMLYCDFPLGRPLGKPGDAAFQRNVLESAFATLSKSAGPVLQEFPQAIHDESDQPLSCPVPPRANANDPEAVDEAKGLRAAYDRSVAANGRTNVGRVTDPDGIPALIGIFQSIADGTPWKEAGVPGGDLLEASKDVMNYYEEAALGLSDHVPAARQAESWLFQKTATGELLKDVRAKLMGEGVKWAMYIAPIEQQ